MQLRGHSTRGRRAAVVLAMALVIGLPPSADAADFFVSAGHVGSGTSASPFGRIQQALDRAQPGDVVHVQPGTYQERLSTVRAGRAARPIVIRGSGERGSVVVTTSGRVATIGHPFITIESLVFDGQYGHDDTVRVTSAASQLVLRNVEVRRSTRDLIDMAGPANVLIEGCVIHRALNAVGGRTDAHGIAAGPVRGLTIRNTEIHTFSGDGVQVDPGRSAPGWTEVTLDTVRIWLAPLTAAENGFAAGTVPGENAVDTKASASMPRARLTVRNVVASGFQNGLVTNMAAFNLKEHVAATLDRVTVYDSEIAFRLRGAGGAATGAWVTVQNAVVYRTGTAFRYEDAIRNLRVFNSTIGRDVPRPFRAAQSGAAGLEVRNLLVLGRLPEEAAHASNLAVNASAFVNAAADDYRLSPKAGAIDRGVALESVLVDRNGVQRPQGKGHDAGAYEWVPVPPP